MYSYICIAICIQYALYIAICIYMCICMYSYMYMYIYCTVVIAIAIVYIIGSHPSRSTWIQACLNLADGGLGYHDVICSGHAAYIAAIFQSSAALCCIDPQIFESGIPVISSFNDFLNACSILSGLINSLSFNDITMLNALSVVFSTYQSSLQSKIYDLQRNHARDSLVGSFNDLNKIAWYHSNVANDARHAGYLSVLPKIFFFYFFKQRNVNFNQEITLP